MPTKNKSSQISFSAAKLSNGTLEMYPFPALLCELQIGTDDMPTSPIVLDEHVVPLLLLFVIRVASVTRMTRVVTAEDGDVWGDGG